MVLQVRQEKAMTEATRMDKKQASLPTSRALRDSRIQLEQNLTALTRGARDRSWSDLLKDAGGRAQQTETVSCRSDSED